jgi:iron complex transport system substrate-binding protein
MNARRVRILLPALTLASAWLSPVRAEIRIRHAQGELVLPAPPKRVVALEFLFVDALVAVGMSPIGIADDRQPERIIEPLRDAVKGYASVGSRYQPSLEAIAALKPDLIIADQRLHQAVYGELKAIAPTLVIDVRSSTYLEDLETLQVVARALGKEEQMRQRLRRHAEVMDKYARSIENGQKLTAVFGVSSDKGSWLHTETTYAAGVLKRLGFDTPLKHDRNRMWSEPYVKIGLEQLLAVNPDILLLGRYSQPAQIDNWAKSPLWRGLKAVQNKRVYWVDGNMWARSRGLISAELMTAQLQNLLRQ